MQRRLNVDKLYDFCLRCHRKLKNEEAKKLGYGKICYQKANSESDKKRLFMPVENKHNM